jgi:hypothetical protein
VWELLWLAPASLGCHFLFLSIAGNRAAHGRDDEVADSGCANDKPSDIQPNPVHCILLGDIKDEMFMMIASRL